MMHMMPHACHVVQFAAASDFESMTDGVRAVPEAIQFSTLGGCTLLHQVSVEAARVTL